MRERTTWNREAIKTAAMNRQADPYTMNQDHVNQQPAADAYVTGTPSDFAEDVTTPNRWEEEYSGGTVERNEIGMPEMRAETFKHPEKTAAVLLKKADLCASVARMMLGKNASETAIENQAYGLMYMPDAELIGTFDRLAAEGQPPMEQQALQQELALQQEPQAAQQQQAAQQDQLATALAANDAQGVQAAVQQMIQQALQQQGCKMAAEEEPKQAQDEPKQEQKKEAGDQQVNIEAMVQQMVQQALQQQAQQQAPAPQAPAPQQGGQQAAQQEQQAAQQQQQAMQQVAPPQEQQAMEQPVQSDDILLDEMLMPGDETGMGIELEPAPMDVGEVVLGPEDEALRTLFANQETQDAEEAQQAQQGGQQQQQQKQAMTRTASTRTVGTKPTQGVSRVGSAAAPTRPADVDKLSNLWQSAPDVSEAFGMKR